MDNHPFGYPGKYWLEKSEFENKSTDELDNEFKNNKDLISTQIEEINKLKKRLFDTKNVNERNEIEE